MKTLFALFALLFLCATASFGQVGASALSNQAQMLQMTDNPRHADQHAMAQEQNLLEHSDYSSAHGERPLWEFGPISQPVPLGDTARAQRKEHAAMKKARVVFEN
jgi:hypothetical protein